MMRMLADLLGVVVLVPFSVNSDSLVNAGGYGDGLCSLAALLPFWASKSKTLVSSPLGFAAGGINSEPVIVRALSAAAEPSPSDYFGFLSPSLSTNSLSSSSVFLSLSNANIDEARRWIGQGMQAFRQGQVTRSIVCFDQAEALAPDLRPYLWQRGISYYYAQQYDQASQQFRTDVLVNPADVEEIVWDIASQLTRQDPSHRTFPISQMLSLPLGVRDRRPVMAKVYQLFRGECSEKEIALFGYNSKRPSDLFYTLFYLGLYNEARGEATKAEYYMRHAVQTDYGTTNRDYMTAVAQVHCQLRGWI